MLNSRKNPYLTSFGFSESQSYTYLVKAGSDYL